MKLLLDEHYSRAIAEQLRQRKHDVVTVRERGWEGVGDEELLENAVGEKRAVVTNNVQDFAPLFNEWSEQGRDHYGLVFTDDRSVPRSNRTIGRYVDALDGLLSERPQIDALLNAQHWFR